MKLLSTAAILTEWYALFSDLDYFTIVVKVKLCVLLSLVRLEIDALSSRALYLLSYLFVTSSSEDEIIPTWRQKDRCDPDLMEVTFFDFLQIENLGP